MGFQNWWALAPHRPPAAPGEVVPRGYPRYHGTWVRGHEGVGQAGGV